MKTTLLEQVTGGALPRAIGQVARDEKIAVTALAASISAGHAVVIRPKVRGGKPLGVGAGLRTKVNANLGTAEGHAGLRVELAKLRAAEKAGADTVMDLSTGGDLKKVRAAIRSATKLPLGSVPIYSAAVNAVRQHGAITGMTAHDMLAAVTEHAEAGIDFVTVHAGLTRHAISHLQEQQRVLNVVSRGGSFLTSWMIHHDQENPYYEYFDELIDILRQHDIALSLGDGLRPGCLNDASDRAQFTELVTLGELGRRARARGVQVMIEGPGHVPLHEVAANIAAEKMLCDGAPFYVLGPLVTDIAPGYDHIVGAIGGAAAAMAGADFLCYVTPSEHLALPGPDDVFQGTMVTRIAAHAADIAKGLPNAMDRDQHMARARQRFDWQAQTRLALDPAKVKQYRKGQSTSDEQCSMCGSLCAIKKVKDYLKGN